MLWSRGGKKSTRWSVPLGERAPCTDQPLAKQGTKVVGKTWHCMCAAFLVEIGRGVWVPNPPRGRELLRGMVYVPGEGLSCHDALCRPQAFRDFCPVAFQSRPWGWITVSSPRRNRAKSLGGPRSRRMLPDDARKASPLANLIMLAMTPIGDSNWQGHRSRCWVHGLWHPSTVICHRMSLGSGDQSMSSFVWR